MGSKSLQKLSLLREAPIEAPKSRQEASEGPFWDVFQALLCFLRPQETCWGNTESVPKLKYQTTSASKPLRRQTTALDIKGAGGMGAKPLRYLWMKISETDAENHEESEICKGLRPHATGPLYIKRGGLAA